MKYVSQKTLKRSQLSGQSGATLVEYSLLVALIAVVCFATVQSLGAAVSEKYSVIDSAIVPIMTQ